MVNNTSENGRCILLHEDLFTILFVNVLQQKGQRIFL